MNFINTIADPASTTTVKRKNKDGSSLNIPCPESVKLYNSNMGRVDNADVKRKAKMLLGDIETTAVTTNQLDLVVMIQISASRTHRDRLPSMYKGNPSKFRPHSTSFFHGIKMCQDMFPFLHIMSKCRLDALSQHTDEFGIVERIHSNSKRLPSNSYSQVIIEHLFSFIENI